MLPSTPFVRLLILWLAQLFNIALVAKYESSHVPGNNVLRVSNSRYLKSAFSQKVNFTETYAHKMT